MKACPIFVACTLVPLVGSTEAEFGFVQSQGLVPVWTYADESGCLETHLNYAALWVTMKGTGIDTGRPSSNITEGKTCAEQGYTKKTDLFKDLPALIRAAYAGVTTWSKPSGRLASVSKLEAASTLEAKGLIPVWTYADESGCLETHLNYAALWITMKGTGIDTGRPSSNITEGKTCAEQGYSNKTDLFKDLPALIRAAYAGVTTWSKPSVGLASVSKPEAASMLEAKGLIPVWTYADESGCLETHVNYAALWITMKGTGIDTGRPSSNITEGKTCAEQGFTNKTDLFKDLPALIRAAYAGVTTWSKPSVGLASVSKLEAASMLEAKGLIPVWTYADESGCLETYLNYAALWITMKGTGIDTGRPSSNITEGKTCAEQGYTKKTDLFKDLPALIRAAYAGVTTWSKPGVRLSSVSELGHVSKVQAKGLMPVWTYADESGCLETHLNYAALWITMKGTGIDTGRPSSNITEGKTCAEQGYTKKTDLFKDLPALIRAAYAGVTTWSKPGVRLSSVSELGQVSKVQAKGLIPVWTYADESGCLETYLNYAALWITMKGTGIDTGRASSSIKEGKTCAEQGYTQQTNIFKDLPAVIRAAYAGVTTWSEPSGSDLVIV